MALSSIYRPGAGAQAFFAALAGGEPPCMADLAGRIALVRRQAGEPVFLAGDAHPFLYVVIEGLMKAVYETEDGEAWIKSFVQEGQFIASAEALNPGGVASFSLIALEPCVLERIPYATLQALADRDLAWSRVVSRAALAFAARKEKRERELLTLTPEGRYRAFLAETPTLAARIPQKDLARHLGVTPVGLNRIVRRVRAG